MTKITVTSPLLPPLDEFIPYLEDIWSRKWLTNNGHYHQELEKALCEYLNVPYISLFSNGTLALVTALQALDLKGEVITTPYSFVATSHAIMWNNLAPVFVDIDPTTFNMDPAQIEAAITDETCAILPVHVYGNPCDHQAIQRVADKHNLKVVYDAAHAFGVKQNEESVLNLGDMSILSFHATKAYSTIEGGAIVCHTQEMKEKLDRLKNFGFESETQIPFVGTNAKMNEIQAAFGLATLKHIDKSLAKRKEIADFYKRNLAYIDGINIFTANSNVELNHSYFPILIDKEVFGMTRDELFDALKENGVLARKYFYPIITEFKAYSKFKGEFFHAEEISNNIICLPIHAELVDEELNKIVTLIGNVDK